MAILNLFFHKKIQKATEDSGQIVMEKIQNELEQATGAELERLSLFEEDFFNSLDKVKCSFAPQTGEKSESMAVTTVLNAVGDLFIPGVGGIYSGYKNAGIKGALVGGVSGAVGMYATAYGIGMILGTLGVTAIAPWMVLPIVFSSAAGGSFVTKKVLELFGMKKTQAKNAIVDYKNQYCEAVKKQS